MYFPFVHLFSDPYSFKWMTDVVCVYVPAVDFLFPSFSTIYSR